MDPRRLYTASQRAQDVLSNIRTKRGGWCSDCSQIGTGSSNSLRSAKPAHVSGDFLSRTIDIVRGVRQFLFVVVTPERGGFEPPKPSASFSKRGRVEP